MNVDLPARRIDFRAALGTGSFDNVVLSACASAMPDAFPSGATLSLAVALSALASKESSFPRVCGYVFKEVCNEFYSYAPVDSRRATDEWITLGLRGVKWVGSGAIPNLKF